MMSYSSYMMTAIIDEELPINSNIINFFCFFILNQKTNASLSFGGL